LQDHWAHCIKSQEDNLERANVDLMEMNIQSRTYINMPHMFNVVELKQLLYLIEIQIFESGIMPCFI